MSSFLKNNVIIFFVLILTSCSTPNWYKPSGYRIFSQMPKGGTPGYNLGWIHGCTSGAGTQFGGAIYITAYKWSRDVDITSSTPNIPVIKERYKKELAGVNWNDPADIKKNFDDYNMVFWDAHLFCRQTILGTIQSATMNAPKPGEVRYDPGIHSIANIWKINGKGDTRWATGYW